VAVSIEALVHCAALCLMHIDIRNAIGLTQKNIQRLFPCDTSMVVVMDDRSDVWNWSPNLIKVKPCE
jgi:hypothetical protein